MATAWPKLPPSAHSLLIVLVFAVAAGPLTQGLPAHRFPVGVRWALSLSVIDACLAHPLGWEPCQERASDFLLLGSQ